MQRSWKNLVFLAKLGTLAGGLWNSSLVLAGETTLQGGELSEAQVRKVEEVRFDREVDALAGAERRFQIPLKIEVVERQAPRPVKVEKKGQ